MAFVVTVSRRSSVPRPPLRRPTLKPRTVPLRIVHPAVAVAAVAVHDPGAAAGAVDRVTAQVDRDAVRADHQPDARAVAQVGVEPHVLR